MPVPTSFPFSSLPMIGRGSELELIRSLLDGTGAGRGGTLVFRGDSGVGKSRLLQSAEAEATRRGWSTASGRAYPVEFGTPYAPFADALVPLLRGLPADSLTALTRGAEADLSYVFPMLRAPDGAAGRMPDSPGELKIRLLWNFTQFLTRFAARRPLLLVLDDLQWADASSLELLHFISRQIGGERIALLCAYNDSLRGQSDGLLALERSLAPLDSVRVHSVGLLSHAETAALIRSAFGAEETVTREFTALLYGWTRGSPFFLEEILKALVQSGRLYRQEGTWLGWELEEVALPTSIREAVLHRLSGLSPTARELADRMAVIGTTIAHAALHRVSGLDEGALVSAVTELRRVRVLEERLDADSVFYDFTHPLLRDTLYAELGLARTRFLHMRVAEALEAHYEPDSIRHADELAYHFVRTHAPHLAPKAVRYLTAAGRAALEKHSDREAADYLQAAIECVSQAGMPDPPRGPLEDLARARQRLGEFDTAVQLWQQVRQAALAAGDEAGVAAAERRLGLVGYWSGRHLDALEHYARGIEWAERAGDVALQTRLRLAEGECLLELGRGADARERIEEALAIAEQSGERSLLARAHLALLLLHIWTGPPDRARAHGERTLSLAEELGDGSLCCTAHWGLTILAGLTGDPAAAGRHNAACARLADELQSPLHRLRAAELAVEYMATTGDWEAGIALGERAIASARSLNQGALLARLLVWTALIHLGRGDLERGRRYVNEAGRLSGAEGSRGPLDVHTVVPALCGRAAYHVAVGEFEAAIRTADRGLAIADHTGYTVWAIHRLLPTLAEAYLSLGDVEGAARTGARLRRDSERLGHELGLAWADACDALVLWLRGDIALAITRLRAAAERLESIAVVPDAARLRRHFAARLRDHGRREEALKELRQVHEVFVRLGAERELIRTRAQIRELGARPPAKESSPGVAGLSAREVEIVRLIAARQSNKVIAKQLDISARTVSTHLTNIFRKLEVDSREKLADLARQMELLGA